MNEPDEDVAYIDFAVRLGVRRIPDEPDSFGMQARVMWPVLVGGADLPWDFVEHAAGAFMQNAARACPDGFEAGLDQIARAAVVARQSGSRRQPFRPDMTMDEAFDGDDAGTYEDD